jgi:hypothetical protein
MFGIKFRTLSKSLFPGILVTLLVLIFSANAVKANGQQDGAAWKTVKSSKLHATPVNFPERNTNDPTSTEIRTAESFSHVQTSLFVRVNHSLFCLFDIAFQETFSEERFQINIALNGLFLTLYSDIIAPNAP